MFLLYSERQLGEYQYQYHTKFLFLVHSYTSQSDWFSHFVFFLQDHFVFIVSQFMYIPWSYAQKQAAIRASLQDGNLSTPSVTIAGAENFESHMTEYLKGQVWIRMLVTKGCMTFDSSMWVNTNWIYVFLLIFYRSALTSQTNFWVLFVIPFFIWRGWAKLKMTKTYLLGSHNLLIKPTKGMLRLSSLSMSALFWP